MIADVLLDRKSKSYGKESDSIKVKEEISLYGTSYPRLGKTGLIKSLKDVIWNGNKIMPPFMIIHGMALAEGGNPVWRDGFDTFAEVVFSKDKIIYLINGTLFLRSPRIMRAAYMSERSSGRYDFRGPGVAIAENFFSELERQILNDEKEELSKRLRADVVFTGTEQDFLDAACAKEIELSPFSAYAVLGDTLPSAGEAGKEKVERILKIVSGGDDNFYAYFERAKKLGYNSLELVTDQIPGRVGIISVKENSVVLNPPLVGKGNFVGVPSNKLKEFYGL